MTKKKTRKPAMPPQRLHSTIVQICDQRIRLFELIQEMSKSKPKWPTLLDDLAAAKAAIERVEARLARAAARDYPDLRLPTICINRRANSEPGSKAD